MMDSTLDNQLRHAALGVLETAVLVRGADGAFRLLEPAPAWWEPVFGSDLQFRSRSPFLDDFVDGAGADFWKGGRGYGESEGRVLRSGIWEEGDGVPRRFFEAVAAHSADGGSHLLLIQAADERWRQEQSFLQNAHEQSLNRRTLLKEVEKKQVLLECIMHDLGNPVTSVLLNLQLISRHLGDEDRGLRLAVDRATGQVERQRQLIRGVAKVFATDLAGGSETPDLVEVGAETAAACAPAATEAGVTLCPFFGPALRVTCEKLELSRVIENLLVNAIRHSRDGNCVNLHFWKEDRFAVCRVEDEGPGIESGLEERLFHAFVRGKSNKGEAGLGLYFCRLSVEKWGGSIRAWNRKERGACFEFRLPLAKKEGSQ